jgi:hypothetical protein
VLLLFYLGSGSLDAWFHFQANGSEELLWQRGLPLGLLLVVMGLFWITKLQTVYDSRGIRLRFYPFHLGWIDYPASSFTAAEVGVYNPIGDFLGWGVRYGRDGYKAYTTQGNRCVRISMIDGRKRLIGTQNPERVKTFVDTYSSNLKDRQ